MKGKNKRHRDAAENFFSLCSPLSSIAKKQKHGKKIARRRRRRREQNVDGRKRQVEFFAQLCFSRRLEGSKVNKLFPCRLCARACARARKKKAMIVDVLIGFLIISVQETVIVQVSHATDTDSSSTKSPWLGSSSGSMRISARQWFEFCHVRLSRESTSVLFAMQLPRRLLCTPGIVGTKRLLQELLMGLCVRRSTTA